MSPQTHILTDVANGVWVESCEFTDPASSTKWSIKKRTLRGGRSDGVDVIEVDNGRLSVSLLPTRGMGIWRGACDGVPVGWKSPVELPVHPSQVNLAEFNGLGWLTGFNEWLCRCGLGWHGAPDEDGGRSLNLHGKIANTPAHFVSVKTPQADELIEVTGVVDETSLFLGALRLTSTLTTRPGSNSITIIDEITNIGGHPTESELLYHINTGRPFLEAGARCEIPHRWVAPRDARAGEGIETWQAFEPPVAGYQEQCYFVEPETDADGDSLALLVNEAADRAVSIRFNTSQLPHFTLWKNTQAEVDGYVAGLEPSTSLPNGRSFERRQGRVILLEPGQSQQAKLELAILTSAEEVVRARAMVSAIQGHCDQPEAFPNPRRECSP